MLALELLYIIQIPIIAMTADEKIKTERKTKSKGIVSYFIRLNHIKIFEILVHLLKKTKAKLQNMFKRNKDAGEVIVVVDINEEMKGKKRN